MVLCTASAGGTPSRTGDWSRTLSFMPQDWHSHCCHARISPAKERAMTRDELTRKILSIKRAKSLSWKTIVAEVGGGSPVYLTAALMGQMKLRPEQAERAAKLFELGRR